jgi:hypothetical protein
MFSTLSSRCSAFSLALFISVLADSAQAVDWIKAREGMGPLHAAAASSSTYVLGGTFGDIWTSSDGATWTRRTTPTGISATINGAVYGGGRFLMVGELRCCTGPDASALVLTSLDGIEWTAVTTAPAGNARGLRAVAFGASRYVAVGSLGQILTSTDSVTWTSGSGGGSQNLKGIAFGGGVFVAVGDNRTVLRSTDGATWSAVSIPSTTGSNYEDVTHTGSQFVAVGDQGAVLTSPDGLTWTNRTFTAPQPNPNVNLGAVASGAGLIVAGDNLRVWSSPDGVTWTQRNLNWSGGEPNPSITTLTYGPSGGFVATGWTAGWGEGGTLHSSPDGLNWTKRTLTETRNLATAAFGNGVFCAAGSSGSVASSTDGIAWTNRNGLPITPNTNNTAFWRSMVMSSVSNVFVVAGNGIMTSPDCITWTSRFPDGLTGFAGVVEGLGLLVAVGARSPTTSSAQTIPTVAISNNGGSSWTTVEPGGEGFIQKVGFRPASAPGGALFVGAGGNATTGEILIYTSANGTTWTKQAPTGIAAPYNFFADLTYGNGSFVLVNGGNLWTSSNGVDWTAHGGGTSAYGVIYTGTKFASVGVSGVNFTSLDGVKWVGSNPITSHSLAGLAYSPGLDRLVSVGSSSIVYATANAAQSGRARYRLYHDGTKEHLYTTDTNEYQTLGTRGWTLEGVAHQALVNDSILDGTLPVALYRLYHPGILQHLWTTDRNEYDTLGNSARGWVPEGIDRYIMDRAVSGQTVPMYRLAHSVLPIHLWTTDINEYTVLATRGWVQEGIVGHVLP